MTRLQTLSLVLAIAASALTATAAQADPLVDNPMHNYANPYDVDANSIVTLSDLDLVLNKLQPDRVDPLVAQIAASEAYYWDTNNNGLVTPNDALWVINRLLLQPVPEPGSVVMCTAALAALAGICWRRRRRP